jgi:peptidyl-prolyl cis-trans isomerase D
MFEFVRRHTRLFQFVLFLLIFPSFIFLGVQGYMQSGANDATVAKVGSEKISQPQWDQAVRIQLDRMRQQMPNVPVDMLNTPALRRQALDELIRQRVILQAADRLHLYTTDARVKSTFENDPQFAFLRNPDGSLNRTAIASQGLTAEQFEARLRQDLVMQQVMLGVASSAIAPTSATDDALDAMFQQREVRTQRFDVKDYVATVNPSDAEITKYYDDPANAAQFQAPESAAVDYVVLDLAAVKAGITVSDDDLRKNYEQNKSRYATQEERRASHILFKIDKGMSDADKAKVKAQAESVLAEVKKNPKSFADMAKKYSADPGSAEKGGDLDFFARGAMVKPFEEAAFSLKPGQISNLVQSDFGYHIIMLTAVRGGETRTFEQVKPELLDAAKTQLAQARYAELAEQFTNTVYEQSDSLQPVIDKLKLTSQKAQGISRTPLPTAAAPLNSEKFLTALFGNDALHNKRNTEAVETGPNQLASGRVTSYQPARKLPLADVKAKVRDALVATQSAELARKAGEARLAALKLAVVDQALGIDTSKLPAYAGVDVPGEGFTVVEVSKIMPRDPKLADPVAAKAQYAQVWGGAELQSYYAGLKARQKAEITASPAQMAGADNSPR